MTKINPFAEPPVYKPDQVITPYDLVAVRNGFIYQYNTAPFWRFIFKYRMLIGIGTIDSLIRFLGNNKKGDHDGETKK